MKKEELKRKEWSRFKQWKWKCWAEMSVKKS